MDLASRMQLFRRRFQPWPRINKYLYNSYLPLSIAALVYKIYPNILIDSRYYCSSIDMLHIICIMYKVLFMLKFYNN